ncbi:MAG: 30S ribosomal protein S12 methylthiotransferase RimO [Sphaerochaetaceae bacterium]|nr:30S ribosomal protein S12 methylthiotransferase RimO [Sphaerochaetaceae bacterium]
MKIIRNTHTVYLESLGCAKNQVDAEVLLTYLAEDGWTKTDDVSQADLIIVNTCGFIESARQESINTFFQLHDARPDAKFIVTGCLSQRYAEALRNDLPEADGIFGNHDLSRILPLVKRVLDGERPVERPEYPSASCERDDRAGLLNFPGSAYVKISEGCSHRCKYCAIPLIRGDLRSRPEDAILAEVRRLISLGIKELNLIAQDLAAYGTDEPGHASRFCRLLEHITAIEGDFVVRLLYIHPDAFPAELPALIASNSKVLPYFDIPFQHAAVPVLRGMGRTGDRSMYLNLVQSIRATLPEAVIRSTIMLGFPGEGRAEFDELMAFIDEARLDWVGSFLYSREEDTPAWKMRNAKEHKKAAKEAAAWQKELEATQEKITAQRLQRFVGNTYDVLIEELVEGEDLAIGRMYAQAPDVDGLTVVMGRNLVPGSRIRCGITKVNGIDLQAIPCMEKK